MPCFRNVRPTFNYDELRKRIRVEYGLTEKATAEERARGKQIGAAAAFKIVVERRNRSPRDVPYVLSTSHKKYLPEETLDMIFKVFGGFTMPALYLIPNESEMKAALERTRLYTPLKHGRLGRQSGPRCARFRQQARAGTCGTGRQASAAGLGPEHVAISRSGEFVVSMDPESAVETTAAADLTIDRSRNHNAPPTLVGGAFRCSGSDLFDRLIEPCAAWRA